LGLLIGISAQRIEKLLGYPAADPMTRTFEIERRCPILPWQKIECTARCRLKSAWRGSAIACESLRAWLQRSSRKVSMAWIATPPSVLGTTD
jgi:hypothetical protein